MKKTVSILTALFLLFSFCSCGSVAPTTPMPTGAVTDKTEPLTEKADRDELSQLIAEATDLYDRKVLVTDIGRGLDISVSIDPSTQWCFADIVFCSTLAIRGFLDQHSSPLYCFTVLATVGHQDGKDVSMMWRSEDLESGLFIDDSTGAAGNTTLDNVLSHCHYDAEEMSALMGTETAQPPDAPTMPDTVFGVAMPPAESAESRGIEDPGDMAAYYIDAWAGACGLSRDNVIWLVEGSGFSHDEAVAGVDEQGIDWNAQAITAAKVMMQDNPGYDRDTYIGNLELLGFTHEQAEYGVVQNGA